VSRYKKYKNSSSACRRLESSSLAQLTAIRNHVTNAVGHTPPVTGVISPADWNVYVRCMETVSDRGARCWQRIQLRWRGVADVAGTTRRV